MYDAIVIGAGHNGLAAAVHLAAKGRQVAVVEQAREAGGAVKTREVTLPGFRHDLFAMNLSMFAGSPFFAAYKDRLFANGCACCRSRSAAMRRKRSRQPIGTRPRNLTPRGCSG